MTQAELLCECLDFIGGGGPMMGLWQPFLDWLREKGYKDQEIDEAAKDAHDECGYDWGGLE